MVIQVSAIVNSVQSLTTALWEQPQSPVDAARSVWRKKEKTVEECLQLVDLVSTVLGISPLLKGQCERLRELLNKPKVCAGINVKYPPNIQPVVFSTRVS